MTPHQIVYQALERALVGPKTDDARRHGTSSDRLEYLTDAVVDSLVKHRILTGSKPEQKTRLTKTSVKR